MTPGRVSVLVDGCEISFAQLDADADTVARGLVERGVRAGDRLAVLMPNGVRFVELVHAAPRAGAIIVPLNTRLSRDELAWQLRDSGASLVVFDDATSDAASAVVDATRVAAVHAGELGRSADGDAHLRYGHELGDVQSIIYTSGTTGTPKGAMLTFGNHAASAAASAANLGVRDDDRLLASLPMFHVGGLAVVLRGVLYGNAVVVLESFDPARVNATIDRDGVTTISVVANMLRRMLDARGDAAYPRSLRTVLLGGGPAPRELLEECAARGLPVLQTYGLTEAASQVATLTPSDALRKLGSAGQPLPGTSIRIESDGRACAAGEPGEILVSGPTISPGYWRRTEETAAAFRDGWLRTGDFGYLDDEGYLYVLDRRNDLIVSGGENVYPAEVESVLQSHPDVAEAAVYGVADARWGAVAAAAVVLCDGAAASADELIAWCRARLARYKTPAHVWFLDELPRNAAGKVQRRLLRERAG
ncbi:MAG: o-succinylbenzoate--CoA ligase [Dehalococcoidia bacterium]|nr:MAG: o-succinylbenzoate--CoA ligase [Dehalococcoidia bacterium]